MGDAAPQMRIDYASYLALERETDQKHEWLDGLVYARAGANPSHNAITARVIGELGRLLGDRPCNAYTSDQKVRVPATGLATYPDALVVCGAAEFDREDPIAIVNPQLVVEVLSDSTELYDRTEKFGHYQRLASLHDYVLVSQHEVHIEVYSRDEGGRWIYTDGRAGERVGLTSLGGALEVDQVYRNVALDPPASRRRPKVLP